MKREELSEVTKGSNWPKLPIRWLAEMVPRNLGTLKSTPPLPNRLLRHLHRGNWAATMPPNWICSLAIFRSTPRPHHSRSTLSKWKTANTMVYNFGTELAPVPFLGASVRSKTSGSCITTIPAGAAVSASWLLRTQRPLRQWSNSPEDTMLTERK